MHVDDGLNGGEGFKEMPVHDGLGGGQLGPVKACFAAGAGFQVDTIFGCEIMFRGKLGGGDNKTRSAAHANIAIAANKISAGVAGVQIMGGQSATGFT